MKKSILKLGRALNKKEQKNTFGGNTFTSPNPDCDGAHDGNGYLYCQCGDGGNCTRNVWTGTGWVPKAGTCSAGNCVAA
ncbi:hypothetical protein CSC81_09720 [Tenacibaculum discolor]|uniref:Uncharacterized protein n=1 Tax=Tenacibaculum discolor TaxID=361581 RepID=A0A2G1BTH9_9FLAO|nr:hypothetical protein [Tenacibaculum discolor]MDP2541642.1 hypothetical protein [Tenacibaculum discolor]PHN97350.1 hypothetical protein CSC81_09720 [Tenacibaculum discolor]